MLIRAMGAAKQGLALGRLDEKLSRGALVGEDQWRFMPLNP